MNAQQQLARLRANWQAVVEQVGHAATGAGRTPQSVRIIGVTKYVGPEVTAGVIAAGCADVGESRPQQLFEKAAALAAAPPAALGAAPPARWHLIGPLQRNKARRTLQVAAVIHSIDSLKLLRYLDTLAGELGVAVQGLIEVNISGDEAKHGFSPSELLRHAETLAEVTQLELIGLMGMAGLQSNSAEAQREFAALRTLRDQLAVASGLPLSELSMGMSGDFTAAIAEGATMVRIGSRLFEGLGL